METQKYADLLKYLKTKKKPEKADGNYEKQAAQFREQFNHIYVDERRLIPEYETTWIMSMFHDNLTSAHQGAEVMRNQINKRYVWPKMGKDIQEYVKRCYECQRRGGPKENNVKITIPPEDIFQR